MSLRQQVLLDVGRILGSTTDFAQNVVLTDPAGVSTGMTGLTGDISRDIDPESGAIIKGKTIHVTVAIQSLPPGEQPVAKRDHADNLWLVSFPDVITSASTGYAVMNTDPDRSVGGLVLELGNVE